MDLSDKTVTASIFYKNFTLANIYKGTCEEDDNDVTDIKSLLDELESRDDEDKVYVEATSQ